MRQVGQSRGVGTIWCRIPAWPRARDVRILSSILLSAGEFCGELTEKGRLKWRALLCTSDQIRVFLIR